MKTVLQSHLITLFLCFVCSHTLAQVNFQTGSYDSLLKLALNQEKLLFVDFRADWCGPCIEMEQTTFQNKDLSNFMDSGYVAMKVDIAHGQGTTMRQQFNVSEIPTMLVIEPNTKEIKLRLIGFKPAHILLKDLNPNRISTVQQVDDAQMVTITERKICIFRRWWNKLFGK